MHFVLNKSILLLLIWSSVVKTQSLKNTNEETESDYFEGDMMLTEEQKKWLTSPVARNGIKAPKFHWPNRTLLYRFSPNVSEPDALRIRKNMLYIASRSCIRFEEVSENVTTYVNISRPKKGCSSDVGFRNKVQELRLGSGCLYNGTIQHELLHALGFYHQQNDPQRDDYIKINSENIRKGYQGQFQKCNQSSVDDFGVGYDYGSIMHYGTHTYSWNKQPVIEPKFPNAVIGKSTGMSDKDFLKLNRMYRC